MGKISVKNPNPYIAEIQCNNASQMNRIAQEEQIISCLEFKGTSSVSSTLSNTAYKQDKCIAYSTCENILCENKKVLIFNSSVTLS